MKNKVKNIETNEIYQNSKLIKKDLIKTFILMIVSFGLLFLIKFLNTNFSLNKFF